MKVSDIERRSPVSPRQDIEKMSIAMDQKSDRRRAVSLKFAQNALLVFAKSGIMKRFLRPLSLLAGKALDMFGVRE